jgi:hypothetical protein
MADPYDILGARKRLTSGGPISYDEIIEQQKQRQIRLGTLQRDTPAQEQTAQRKIARETGAPIGVVQADPARAKDEARVQRAQALAKGNPRLTRTLSDPYKSALAEQDYSEIIRTNKALKKKAKASNYKYIKDAYAPTLNLIKNPFSSAAWKQYYKTGVANIAGAGDTLVGGLYQMQDPAIGLSVGLLENINELGQNMGLPVLPGLAEIQRGVARISRKTRARWSAGLNRVCCPPPHRSPHF